MRVGELGSFSKWKNKLILLGRKILITSPSTPSACILGGAAGGWPEPPLPLVPSRHPHPHPQPAQARIGLHHAPRERGWWPWSPRAGWWQCNSGGGKEEEKEEDDELRVPPLPSAQQPPNEWPYEEQFKQLGWRPSHKLAQSLRHGITHPTLT